MADNFFDQFIPAEGGGDTGGGYFDRFLPEPEQFGPPPPPQPPEGVVYSPQTGQMVDTKAMAQARGTTPAQAALLGAGQGISYGAMDETVAGLYGLTGPGTIRENYDYALARHRADLDAAREARPGITLASEVGTSMLAPAAVLKGAKTIKGAAAAGAATGALGGGLYGLGSGEGGFENRLREARNVGAAGAVLGGALGAASWKVESLARSSAAKRSVSSAAADALSPEELRVLGQKGYKALEKRGIKVKEDVFADFTRKLGERMDDAGMDTALTKTASRGYARLVKMTKDGTTTFRKIDAARRVAKSLPKMASDSEIAMSQKLVGEIDDFVYRLIDEDLVAGNSKGLQAELLRVRDLWRRMKASDDIQEAIKEAGFAKSGFENGLRLQFERLRKDKALMKSLPKPAADAIEQVIKGTTVGNWLSRAARIGFGLGHRNTAVGGGVMSIGGATLGTLATGSPIGGAIGGAIPPVLGHIGAKGAEKITLGLANRAMGAAAAKSFPKVAPRLGVANALAAAPRGTAPVANALAGRPQ